jgi:hypothetical protein
MRLLLLGLLALAQTAPKPPAPFVIRESGMADRWVCAEYRSGVPPVLNRSCQPAATVRQWLLQNGRDGVE